jgi:hypothetical protein
MMGIPDLWWSPSEGLIEREDRITDYDYPWSDEEPS